MGGPKPERRGRDGWFLVGRKRDDAVERESLEKVWNVEPRGCNPARQAFDVGFMFVSQILNECVTDPFCCIVFSILRVGWNVTVLVRVRNPSFHERQRERERSLVGLGSLT